MQARSLRVQERLARNAAIAQEHLSRSVEEVAFSIRSDRRLEAAPQMEYLADSIRSLHFAIRELVESRLTDLRPTEQHVVINSIANGSDPERDAFLVKELAHSLNTPLLSIEALALTVRATQGSSPEIDHTLSAVSVCKSFIAAFQEISSVFDKTNEWAPDSLKESVEGAFKVYTQQASKNLTAVIELPQTIDGYSNSFLVAILLPLIENAIEASPPKSKVRIDCAIADALVLNVVNGFSGIAFGDEVYTAGHSSKAGHQGLGLPTVSRLVSTYRNGRVFHEIADGEVRFTIILPRRRRD
ncbi:ATP-binding protein [Micromonospora profundi]